MNAAQLNESNCIQLNNEQYVLCSIQIKCGISFLFSTQNFKHLCLLFLFFAIILFLGGGGTFHPICYIFTTVLPTMSSMCVLLCLCHKLLVYWQIFHKLFILIDKYGSPNVKWHLTSNCSYFIFFFLNKQKKPLSGNMLLSSIFPLSYVPP